MADTIQQHTYMLRNNCINMIKHFDIFLLLERAINDRITLSIYTRSLRIQNTHLGMRNICGVRKTPQKVVNNFFVIHELIYVPSVQRKLFNMLNNKNKTISIAMR